MLRQLNSELPARGSIFKASIEARLSNANRAPRDTVTTVVQCRADNMRETKTDSANEMIRRNKAIAELEFRQQRCPRPDDSPQWPAREPPGISRDEKRGQFSFTTDQRQ